MGRGGNVCRCNGFHFAGKRSDNNVIPSSSEELNSISSQLMSLLDDPSQVQSLKSDSKYEDILHGQAHEKLQDNSQIRDEDLRLVLSILLKEIIEGRYVRHTLKYYILLTPFLRYDRMYSIIQSTKV
ncbi:hypothetical protein ACJMK2_021521 [Sinanodonta woodiana]|uniref:Uncharacterized protein n=1 Tax=Sinanodonta woodiana TaxID=1069815 RepID=A0ABD3TI99_SINWO